MRKSRKNLLGQKFSPKTTRREKGGKREKNAKRRKMRENAKRRKRRTFSQQFFFDQEISPGENSKFGEVIAQFLYE